jgi:8-oxo-dGTP pyrophosphatase MutT (NUDIX family)
MNKPSSGTKKPPKSRFEFSAGGIVREGVNLLMVRVQNLEGQKIWTFPKGHIEKGEKAPQAALREVEEETGYQCDIVKPFERVQYYFRRDDQVTKKTVTWFLMAPVKKTGTHDPEEILETEWVSMEEALKRVKYKSDKQLLAKLK